MEVINAIKGNIMRRISHFFYKRKIKSGQRLLFAVLFSMVFVISGYTQTTKSVKVKYISADKVYIDAGKAVGVNVNDILDIIKNGKSIARLRVVYVAEHSASCEIVSGKSAITVGASVKINPIKITPKTEKETNGRRTRQELKKNKKSKKSSTRVSGYLGAQWYQFVDAQNVRNNFNQPTVRFKLKVKNMWDDAYNLKIKARSRYNKRTRSISSDVPAKEWRNRIYEVSFSYDNPSSFLNYKAGRIISNKFSGVGYIDGLLLQHNVTNKFHWGLFGGTQPEWQYSGVQTGFQKYGLYLNYVRGDYGQQRFESTLALAGAYHGSTVSREFLYFQNSYNSGRKWNFYQSLELDINRDWRKDATGETISLTGVYINGRYNITNKMYVGLNYDNRKNYFTYETRNLVEGLFNDALRQGMRVSFNWRFLKNYRVFTNIGARKRDSNRDLTYSYTGGFSIANLFKQRMTLATRFSGFSNFYTEGMSPSISVSKYFRGGHSLRLNYGNYFYNLKTGGNERLNQWARLDGQIELPFRFYLSNNYEYTWGDDSKGHRIFSEIGYRF
ncbi:MAG: hypothetical protein D8M58_12675 [Calditrichaeota bacterium]|nr:MAG: hypothetical protein DWQ03_13460 [Calditrichota bacterium]MBL1206252.1 hypothetical protein [Calditrichota bacterium]